MMKKFFATTCFSIGLLLISLSSFAWGLTGHRVVAEIADHYLNRKARRNLERVLGDESLAMAANWADFIKSDPHYAYLNSWHYINFKSGLSFQQLQQQTEHDTVGNAFNKLNWLIGELHKETLTLDQKRMYLKLLIHIVGDIHQPMHTGRPEDLGGNRIKLYWFNTPTNLHRIWDEQLIDFQQLSYTEYVKAINYATREEQHKWQQGGIDTWLYESYQLSEKLYAEIRPEEKLSYRYNFDNIDILNKQLLKGGIRLAKILNDIFG